MTEKKSQSTVIYDVMAVAGVCALGVGCWMAWPPLGLIVPGALLLAGAINGARRGAEPK